MVNEINTDLDKNENDSVPVDLVPSTSVQSKRRSSSSILIGMFLTMKSPLTTTIVQYSPYSAINYSLQFITEQKCPDFNTRLSYSIYIITDDFTHHGWETLWVEEGLKVEPMSVHISIFFNSLKCP